MVIQPSSGPGTQRRPQNDRAAGRESTAHERDAIVQALLDFGGNKVKTAESLGMSRATIYRKIHEYGIVTPSS